MKHLLLCCAALVSTLAAVPTFGAAQSLSRAERQIVERARANRDGAIRLLEETVNISSGSLNVAGVRAVGDVFRRELEAIGFTVRWAELPPAMGRAGHLIAERRPTRRSRRPGKRVLLIGHLDTVFEGENQRFVRDDTVARGAGTSDMKAGDVVIVHALRALHEARALDDAEIVVVLTGDEEYPGDPMSVTRAPLIDAAKRTDVALAFEGSVEGTGTIGRRGTTGWILRTAGRQAHSSGIFGEGTGYGAVYEAARILDAFREKLAGEQYLTFNPGVILGAEQVAYDSVRLSGTAAGKTNIVAPTTVVQGDLRFLSADQRERAIERMREIVRGNLPGTSAEIVFQEGYPAMTPTDGHRRVLAMYDAVSRALGGDSIIAIDPSRRGAGDIAFVAHLVDGLDGLGPRGFGSHSPREGVYLPSILEATERAAVLIHRLTRPR